MAEYNPHKTYKLSKLYEDRVHRLFKGNNFFSLKNPGVYIKKGYTYTPEKCVICLERADVKIGNILSYKNIIKRLTESGKYSRVVKKNMIDNLPVGKKIRRGIRYVKKNRYMKVQDIEEIDNKTFIEKGTYVKYKIVYDKKFKN